MISDLGSNFKKFADQLGITSKKPYFNASGKEIIFMFDPPHLLKATRNNFFNYRFESDNKIAEKVHLQNFYELDKNRNIRLAPKLTDIHINPSSFQKMKVKYASQVFSKTVAASMETCVITGSLSGEAFDTINFIQSMDNLFDIFNSRPLSSIPDSFSELTNSKCFCLPFRNSDFQVEFLKSMIDYFELLNV